MKTQSKKSIQEQRFQIDLLMNGIALDEVVEVIVDYLPAGAIQERDAETRSVTDHLERKWTVFLVNGPENISCVLSTPMLAYEDMDELLYLAQALKDRGAKGGEGCGMRFFASTEMESPRTILNLANILSSKGSLLAKAVQASACDKLRKMEELEDNNRAEVFPCPVAKNLDTDEMKGCIQLGCAILAQAANQTRVSAKDAEPSNERYAFRCWLLRMGLIGDEYKPMRMRLLKRLEGCSSRSVVSS